MYDIFVTLLDVLDDEFMSLYSRRRKGSKGLFPPFQEIMTDRPTNRQTEMRLNRNRVVLF